MLGYPFRESIQSVLELVDEFVVAVGKGDDNTLKLLNEIKSSKVRIVETHWNENMKTRGYVYGQQKMIAQFSCSGDWIFYLEGDEVIHEKDIALIRSRLEQYLHNDNVEALFFNYLHFYGNSNTYIWSPGWYRKEARIIKASVRTYAPDGLYWIVLTQKNKGRYPYAANSGATIYHYGWVRNEKSAQLKNQQVGKYWNEDARDFRYEDMDSRVLKYFIGEHPSVIKNWLPREDGIFKTNPHYNPSIKQNKNYLLLKFEQFFNLELSKKHFISVGK